MDSRQEFSVSISLKLPEGVDGHCGHSFYGEPAHLSLVARSNESKNDAIQKLYKAIHEIEKASRS